MHVRDQDKIVYSILPTNRWPNGENEPEVRTISPNVYRSLTRTMARMAGYS